MLLKGIMLVVYNVRVCVCMCADPVIDFCLIQVVTVGLELIAKWR